MQEENGDVTELLRKWRAGDKAAEEQLFELVFPVLRKRARALLSRERRGHPLASAQLVVEVYTALVRAKDRDWRDRAHFFAIAARAASATRCSPGRGCAESHCHVRISKLRHDERRRKLLRTQRHDLAKSRLRDAAGAALVGGESTHYPVMSEKSICIDLQEITDGAVHCRR